MLSAKQSAYCPTCKIHSSQERGKERATRYCGGCGNTFTLKHSEAAKIIDDAMPDSWLDPLLSGPAAVVGKPPFGCPDVERLLSAIRDRLVIALASAK